VTTQTLAKNWKTKAGENFISGKEVSVLYFIFITLQPTFPTSSIDH
jgi:hypothetical protein